MSSPDHRGSPDIAGSLPFSVNRRVMNKIQLIWIRAHRGSADTLLHIKPANLTRGALLNPPAAPHIFQEPTNPAMHFMLSDFMEKTLKCSHHHIIFYYWSHILLNIEF